jgi:hypothetical protein
MAQEHGPRAAAVAAAALLGMILMAPGITRSDDKVKASVTAKEAFAKLKTLKGTWKNKTSSAEHHDAGADPKVTYRLTGAGSALVETDFPDSDHEMVSVYHLDGEELRLTHYCAVGNQPRLKLDRASSSPTRLVFVFDGGTNLDPSKDMHIHGMTLTFQNKDAVETTWESYVGGKPAEIMRFQLTPVNR